MIPPCIVCPMGNACTRYAQHMSLMDSIMFGEGFNDGVCSTSGASAGSCGGADWMLLATSGLQFGLFNDMLTSPSLFRGMVFGMWGRPPYSQVEQNRQLWAWIDSSGLTANDTEMLGCGQHNLLTALRRAVCCMAWHQPGWPCATCTAVGVGWGPLVAGVKSVDGFGCSVNSHGSGMV